jgi:hypothetical protein
VGGGEPPRHSTALRVYGARMQRPGQSATERDVTWPAHVRGEIRRGLASPLGSRRCALHQLVMSGWSRGDVSS